MARIYDNIETKFTQGLQGIITNVLAISSCVVGENNDEEGWY